MREPACTIPVRTAADAISVVLKTGQRRVLAAGGGCGVRIAVETEFAVPRKGPRAEQTCAWYRPPMVRSGARRLASLLWTYGAAYERDLSARG